MLPSRIIEVLVASNGKNPLEEQDLNRTDTSRFIPDPYQKSGE